VSNRILETSKGLSSRIVSIIPYRWRMMLPLLLVLGAIVAYPLGYSLWLSLRDYEILQPTDVSFVGL
jgi:multiple sugar transport system permease protein